MVFHIRSDGRKGRSAQPAAERDNSAESGAVPVPDPIQRRCFSSIMRRPHVTAADRLNPAAQ